MGINRDSRHKRRSTGGRMPIHKKKRAFEEEKCAVKETHIKRKSQVRQSEPNKARTWENAAQELRAHNPKF